MASRKPDWCSPPLLGASGGGGGAVFPAYKDNSPLCLLQRPCCLVETLLLGSALFTLLWSRCPWDLAASIGDCSGHSSPPARPPPMFPPLGP